MSELTPIEVEGALASDYATDTAVGLLDALADAMALARPGRDSARFATDLRRLGDGAAFVAQELGAIMRGEALPAESSRALDGKSRVRTAL